MTDFALGGIETMGSLLIGAALPVVVVFAKPIPRGRQIEDLTDSIGSLADERKLVLEREAIDCRDDALAGFDDDAASELVFTLFELVSLSLLDIAMIIAKYLA